MISCPKPNTHPANGHSMDTLCPVCVTTNETGLRMKRSQRGRERRGGVGGEKKEKRGGGEEKLAKLPICTWEVRISSGTIFLCNTGHRKVAKRHDTA